MEKAISPMRKLRGMENVKEDYELDDSEIEVDETHHSEKFELKLKNTED